MSGKIESRVNKLVYGAIVGLSLLTTRVVQVRADIITWYYQDDFNDLDTRKAENDSYSHSLFRAEEPNVPPMPEPELQSNLYYSFYHNPWYDHPLNVLLFKGASDGNEPAFLTYAFPLNSQLERVVSGTVVVGTVMTCPPCLDLRPSGLSYELSEDGINWTNPIELFEGHAQVSLLPTDNYSTHIRFFGQEAMLESITITISGPKRAKTLVGDINNDYNTPGFSDQ